MNDLVLQLKSAFLLYGLSITPEKDHIVIENSQKEEIEKIRKIITDCHLFPIIFRSNDHDNFKFTVTPYKRPASYKRSEFALEASTNPMKILEETPYLITDIIGEEN